jgi:excisionase family DNA binding protein
MVNIDSMNDKLDRLTEIVEELIRQKSVKDWYTTAEVAEILRKSDYTVREYCRKGQVNAMKASNGRGWLISQEELNRLRNFGPLPEPKN